MVEDNQERINKEQYLLKLSILEQQANQLEQKMKIVEQQVNEMEVLKNSLENLKKGEGKEMLASLGKGIFLKTEIKDKELLVDVGSKTVVKKSFSDTIKIIEKQVKELEKIREEIFKRINQLNGEMEKTIFAGKEGKFEEESEETDTEKGKEEALEMMGIPKDIDKEKLDERKLAKLE